MEQGPPTRCAARRSQLDPRQPDRKQVPRPDDLRVRRRRAICRRRRDGRGTWRQRRRELSRRDEGLEGSGPPTGDSMSEVALSPTYQVAPDSTVKPEEVIEVLRQCFDPEIPVNIIDLGLVYDIAIKPERVDVKMTLTALGCPMAADVMADVRDHLLTLPGVKDAGVDIVYEPVWTPERMSEEARWEWSNPHSGRMRPHVPNLRDDRLCLGAGLQVVDVGLSGGRSRGTAAVAWIQIARHTRPFSLIPDIARRKKSRLAPRSRKLSYFVRGCVEQGDTRFAKGVPLHIDNLAAGRRSLRAYPRNEWKHQRLVSVAPNLNALSVPKVETSARPDRH